MEMYQGRLMNVSVFRAYVYGDGEKKLVNNWHEFKEALAAGWRESKAVKDDDDKAVSNPVLPTNKRRKSNSTTAGRQPKSRANGS
jgi:hypothetical protein